MKRRWIALLLALTMAASLLAGCTKKSDTPAQPEQGQTEQEENQTKPEENPTKEEQPDVTPENPDDTPENPDDAEKPSDEQTPEEETSEEEPELTEEQKRRLRIEQAVEESTIWAADEAYNNFFTEELLKSRLEDFLFQNWDNAALGISDYFDADDFRLNLYQNSLDEYFCVLSHTDRYQELSIRLNADGASVYTPGTNAGSANASAEIESLVDGAKFDKRYDGYYFDDNMDAQANKTFKAWGAQALNGFQKTLEENRQAWKVVLDDAYRVTVSFDENDQFVLELQGKTSYWLELRYRPECGVWADVSLVPTFESDLSDWRPEELKLTDPYLISLVHTLELGMTSAPFTFDRPKDLTPEQLWLMFLLLTPKQELEATYEKQDKMYHITQEMMEHTLSQYMKGYSLDISKSKNYDAATDEIVVPTVSGFGGDSLAKLREKSVDGNAVTFTVDYYSPDDVNYASVQKSKTYTVTFLYGRYRYESAVEAAALPLGNG